MSQSIKTWSNVVQTFSGNTSVLWSGLNANRDYLFDIHVQLARELKDRTVLYTQDIEEKYKRATHDHDAGDESPTKRRKIDSPTADEYLKVLFDDSDFFGMIESPIARMTIYFAADIPWALDNAMSLDVFKEFVSELLLRSQKALITNGDPVGIVAAQSASERFTQTTLNTFHLAGTKKSAVTGGIERIKQLLGGTKSLKVPILGPIITKPGSDPTMLIERSLDDYCDASGVMYKPLDDEKYSNFCIFLKLKNDWAWRNIIRDKLSPSFRRDSYVDPDDGAIYIKFTSKHTMDDIKIAYAKLIRSQMSGLKSCIEYDEEDKVLIFAPKTPLVKTRLVDKSMHSIIDNALILENCPDVDLTKMFSNDIYYIQTTLGIAAAESFIFEELKRTLGSEGININPAHINLMAANMTVAGSITPNTFAGVELEDSVILKATFQESTKTFANAAFNNFTDHINDVSAQIMVGMQPRIGTQRVGCFYKEVGEVVEKQPTGYAPASPEYAPASPEYAELPDDYDQDAYVPSSPVYAPSSPVYYVDGKLAEPEIDI